MYMDALQLGNTPGEEFIGIALMNAFLWVLVIPSWLGQRAEEGGENLAVPGTLLAVAVAASLVYWWFVIDEAVDAFQQQLNSF